MSYRTRVNDFQIFGNNEQYDEWDEFIRSQGITIGPEGDYDGEIHDFYGAVLALESIVKRLMSERKSEWAQNKNRVEKILGSDPENAWALRQKANLTRSYLDFSGFEKDLDAKEESLLDILFQISHEGIVFYPFAFWLACRDSVELAETGIMRDQDGTYRIRNYKFKPGMSATVHAG